MTNQKLALNIVLFFTAVLAASGDTLRVSPDATGTPVDGSTWNQAFRTLQDALAAASAGDEVWVAAGAYTPAGSGGDRSASFALPDGVALYGGFAGGETLREGRDLLVNLTILSGDLNGDDAEDLLDDNSFHVVTRSGSGAQAVLDSVTITGGNAAGAAPDDGGGGIYVTGSLRLDGCIIEGNRAAGPGGGISSDNTAIEIADCRVVSNQAGAGGGLFIRDGVATLVRTLVLDNEAGLGGGVYTASSADLSATNCVIGDNTAGLDGAGVYNSTNSACDLLHCTFSGNRGGMNGGAIANWSGATTVAENCIFWGDAPDEIHDYDPGLSALATCIIEGGWAGTGNLDANPRFRLSTTPFPYQLSWDSPAIDGAGDAGLADDVQGELRPQNAGPDIGADEFGEDTDGGGLPDWYETQHGFALNDPSDDALDSDNDGLDNREEFRRDTHPKDDTDPRSVFYVDALNGRDDTGNGTVLSPWQTIGHTLASVPEGATTFPITIHLEAGTYEEPIVFRPYVQIIGANAETTTIQYYNASDDEHIVVTAAEGAKIEACTITIPYAVTDTEVELIRIDGVTMEVACCTVNGFDSPHAIGLFVRNPASTGSVVRDSIIKRLEYGVYAVNTGVNVTRNIFEDTTDGSVFIRPPEAKQDGPAATPLLGDAEKPLETGLNRFRTDTGYLVKTESQAETLAENNDWGVYTDTEIENRLFIETGAGDVDYEPYIIKPFLQGSAAIELRDKTTGGDIPESASPTVSLDQIGGTHHDEAAGSLCVFTELEEGTYRATGSAQGYVTEQGTVNITGSGIATLALELEGSEGEGEGEGPPPNGCAGSTLSDSYPGGPFPSGSANVALFAVLLLALGVFPRRGPRPGNPTQ